MISRFWILLCFVLLCAYGQDDKILMSDIKVITLRSGALAANRRVAPVAQLTCVGGSASSFPDYQPKVVQCTNQGSDGSATNMQWRCEADLDTAVRFGELRVSCEGYSDSKDPYVLKGSCGLSYMLELTEQGRLKLKADNRLNRYDNGGGYYDRGMYYNGWGSFGSFVFLAVLIFCIVRACNAGRRPSISNAGHYSGTYAQPYAYDAPLPSPGGFWTGMMAGSVLSNMFNRPSYGYLPHYHAPVHSSFGGGSSFDSFASTTRSSVGFADSTNR